jgi:hypothetical protein
VINPFRAAATVTHSEETIPIMSSGRWEHEGVSMSWDDGSQFVELSITKNGTQTVRLSVDDLFKIHVAMAEGLVRAKRRSPLASPERGE